MSDDTPGAGQGALPPKEGQSLRSVGAAERPAMRLTQMAGGQYVLTTQTQHGIPALTQLSPATLQSVHQGGITRIISLSSTKGQTASTTQRPSITNQSIVNVLTKNNRTSPNVRLPLYSNNDGPTTSTGSTTPTHHNTTRPLKRPASSEKKDSASAKLQRVMNHRIVRSKLVKEKYAEHLLELFYLESGGNILDLYQYAKRPKSQTYLNYMKEHSIDPKDYSSSNEISSVNIPVTTPSTPSATSASSLPGITLTSSTPQTTSQSSVAASSTITVSSETPSASFKSSLSNTCSFSNNSQEQIVEKAKQEAHVVQRINDLQKEGLWSERRLPKLQEMPRAKAHWDFLLEEMVWLAADFAQERKWKKAAAKKCARMVQKYFQDKNSAAQKAEKAQEQHLKRIAAFCAKEVKTFWSNVEKLVEYKQNTILEEKRKKALDQHLSFIVDQTEKYSKVIAEGMNKSSSDIQPVNNTQLIKTTTQKLQSDDEFDPDMQSDEDDEETIEQEEAALENVDQSAEVEALQRESQLDLDDLLEDEFLKNYLLNRDKINLSDSENSDVESEEKKSKKSENIVSGTSKKTKKKLSESEESDNNDEVNDSDEEIELTESENDSDETRDSQTEDQSLKSLIDNSHHHKKGDKSKTDEKDDLINDAAAIAESIQPKGNTLSSTTVSTKVPFLLKLPLREYQHIGLDWLVTMYERKLNGILADEMGLGKTIQTIALLAHLACEKENWGPHLIVVPTSVMLNWEMECKKWCPAFKILTYYGTQKERKQKRTGWTKPNAFHICITSYKLVIQDHQSFRRKKWKYLILDEAQNIKNFKSQRWQLLLNFQTERRLLLTGTPLQNNLMELWSLMHFLMPNVFQSHREFKEWFSNPVTGMIEGNSEYNESIIKRLHKVLRPFLLRRLKSEVEKQMPKKYEHVVMCRLSKRQRFLYDDYMSRTKTKETLTTGNLLSVINVLMQLRKVCNHPNLFEVRPTISPFQCDNIRYHIPSIVYSALQYDVFKHVNLYAMNFVLIMLEMHLGAYQCYRMRQSANKKIIEVVQQPNNSGKMPPCPPCKLSMKVKLRDPKTEIKKEPASLPQIPQQLRNSTPNSKVKVAGLQLVGQGVVKTVPLINISQATGGFGTPINVSSVLKPTDKVPASFAQLVQTSTGKHLLLTSNPNLTGNVPVSQTTAGGQKLTFVSTKHSIGANANNPQAMKTFLKFQLTSAPTGTTTTSSISTAVSKAQEDAITHRTVNSNFLGQLYSKQNNSNVRCKKDDIVRRTAAGGNTVHEEEPKSDYKRRIKLMSKVNQKRCSALPLYGRDFQDVIKIYKPNSVDPWSAGNINCLNVLYNKSMDETTNFLKHILYSPERRIEQLKDICDRFIFYVPAVKTEEPELRVWHPPPSEYWIRKEEKLIIQHLFSKPATPLHHIASAMVTQFPDPRLIQYDCGKLQTLNKLLRHLKTDSHRVLIFTQMTKMLDVLEAFLNFHGHIYLRLDGTTKVDQRQVLMERFNGDKRIFVFILSTRSGGVGVNLTGADTVIFYDSDWNPTMDAQAQDRCHRIGQTRDVHIYRLISERTIEENILKKANQKRLLGDLAIEGGNFTTAYFKSSTIQDLFSIDQTLETAAQRMSEVVESRREASVSTDSLPDEKTAAGALENALTACEDDQDVQAAKTAKAEAVADLAEFDENIPLDQETEKEPEVSKAEQEINHIINKLSPIEKYAMNFIEQTESAWSAEQLAAAEREIEEKKRQWELNQKAAMREEEERRQKELEEENDMITYAREDAINQVRLKKRKKIKFRKVLRKTTKTTSGVKVLRKKRLKTKKIQKSKRIKTIKRVAARNKCLNKIDLVEEVDHISNSTPILVEENNEDVTEENRNNTLNNTSEEEGSTADSVQSESDLTLSQLKPLCNNLNTNSYFNVKNHVDENSPRTRSRGTVGINLWTLDVSPILPQRSKKRSTAGQEPNSLKKSSEIKSKRKACSDDDDDGGGGVKKRTAKKAKTEDKDEIIESDSEIDLEDENEDATTNNEELQSCQVILNDIMAVGTYKYSEDSSQTSINNSEEVSSAKKNLNGEREKTNITDKNAKLNFKKLCDATDDSLNNSEIIIINDSDENKEDTNIGENNIDVDDNNFISEYEKEFNNEIAEEGKKEKCDNLSNNTAMASKTEIYVATYVNTPCMNSINNGLNDKRLENPKENFKVKLNNKAATGRSFSNFRGNTETKNKTLKKFNNRTANNQTLDKWFGKAPP